MRKFASLLAMLLFCCAVAFSQIKTISGRVTNDKGEGLPYATVQIKGKPTAVTTDVNGQFSIKAQPGDVLEITAVGQQAATITVGEKDVVAVTLLSSGTEALTEVVVTGAYGTKRTARSTSYNAQLVSSEDLNVIRQPNLNNALAGKVAGLQVRSQSAAALGRNTAIRLRGESGLGGGAGAIYVVDGTILPNADDVNIDDIEDVTVLQGPAAAAQFGPQGAQGAIVISLKKGRRSAKGFTIDVNTGVQIDKAYILPNYQNSYAGGGNSDLQKYTWQDGDPEEWKALDGKFFHDYNDDASWGPRMVGQEYVPWYSWYGGHKYSYTTEKLLPQPDNARDFFNTGVTLNNSISFSRNTDASSIRVSYGNLDVKGLIPNSSLKRNNLNLVSTFDLSSKFTVGANINYVTQTLKGEINDGYSNQSTGSFSQWFHRNLDMDKMEELRGLRTPDGIYASWNHASPNSYDPGNPRAFYAGNYWYNFYTWYDLTNLTNQRDRLYGDVSLTYNVTNDLKIKGTYRKQQNNVWSEDKFSSDLFNSGLQTTGNEPRAKGYYATNQSYSNRRNLELIASYSKQIKDFSVDVNAGADFFKWVSKSNGAATNNGLNVPNLYTTANSRDAASIFNGRTEEKYNAVFTRGSVGFRKFLYGEFTLRNDWFSTLPPADNDVLSKSFGLSFVFSDLIRDVTPWLSNGKLRASWGEIPQTLGTGTTFGAYVYPGFAYGVGQFQWNGNFLMGTPDQLVDSAIRGAVSQQKEIGLDLEFMNGRAGLSVTYWDGSEKDFPRAVTMNGASGFTSKLINTGLITKKGIEIKANGRPVWLPNFKWEISGTYGRLLENKVVEIAPGTSRITVQGVWGATMPYLVHEEGKEWGQIYGNGIKRLNGRPILASDGSYVNDPNVYFGSVLPKFTGGLQNSFQFLKHFTANVNIDFQYGGKFASLSNMWGSYSGLTARTATTNDLGNPIRDAVADGGGVHVFGVDADGKDVDYYVEAQDYFHNLYGKATFDEFVYDLTFVKLREISLGYNLPIKQLGMDRYFRNITFSLVARNPVLIYAKTDDFDPSEISAISGETGQLPGTRGVGFNLKIGF